MSLIHQQNRVLRKADPSDVANLRILVNAAYQELADLGLNYTGSYQDDEITLQRLQSNDVYLVEENGELIATVSLDISQPLDEEPCVYISQLAVAPKLKRQGLGSYLLSFSETFARSAQVRRLKLDTAIPATHLVSLYEKHGFRKIAEVQWEGKTYRSCIMEKTLHS